MEDIQRGQDDRNSEAFDDLAVDFLEYLRPRGPWVLSAIVPDGAIETITARAAAEVRAFVRKHGGNRNLYYSVNPPRRDLASKAAKTDIAAIEYALADLDPNPGEASLEAKTRYLEQLKTFKPKPTAMSIRATEFNFYGGLRCRSFSPRHRELRMTGANPGLPIPRKLRRRSTTWKPASKG